MTLDTRWEDVDQLLVRTTRTKDEKHVKAVHEIAEARFKFPTPEFPSYRTYVNVPEVTMAAKVGDQEIAPEIVVVERLKTGDTRLEMTAVVCDVEQVNPGEAKRMWGRCAGLKDVAFYLYVPVGYGAKAKSICRKVGIETDGVRTWRWTPRGFEINDITEKPSPLAALMPGFVRKALATP